MRKVWAWLLAAGLMCTACTDRNADYYEHAQRYLGGGEYEAAAYIFDQLGEYRDAAEYSLYTRALEAIAAGDWALARTNLEMIAPFKSAERYLAYLDAVALKEAGALEEAQLAFEALGSFADSRELAAALGKAIPLQQLSRCQALVEQGAYEQALALLEGMTLTGDVQQLMEACREGILRAQYDKACLMYQKGEYEEAMAAFEALGDVLDAPARVTLCQGALYRQAASLTPTLENAAQLMADFGLLGDYLDSVDHLAALEAQFARNLAILAAEDYPHVALGSYPVAESGAPGTLTWRVMSTEGSRATLLCDQVIDAGSVATATDLPIDWGEAAVEASLPTAEMASALPAALAKATATPYALAQGVRHHEDGAAWWWLADAAEDGRQQIVWYTGTILPGGVDAAESVVGVRPVAVVDLAEFFFTEGEGTAEEPYR